MRRVTARGRRVTWAFLAVVVLLLLVAAAPSAAAESRQRGAAPGSVAARAVAPATGDGCGAADGSGTLAGSDANLAINRWADVADTFHDRLDGDLWNDVIEKIQRRAVYSTMLSTGNSMWQASSNLVSFATRFCLLDTLGADADRVAAVVGGAFLGDGGPLLAAIVAAGLAAAVWRQARGRGQGAWRGLARAGLLIAVMAVMVAGASRTTVVTAPEDGSTATDFGIGSPGWAATRINALIAAVASAPAKAIADQGSVTEQTADTTGDPLSCAAFTANMRANYQDLYLSGPARLGASVPLVMSQMWENTGLMVWVNSQFGASNPYGPRVFCHVLENRLGTTRWLMSNTDVPRRTDGFGPRQGSGNGTVMGLLLDANRAGVPGVNGEAPAWDFRGEDTAEDASVIGWAACRWAGDWSVDPQWALVASGGDSGGGDGFDGGDSGSPVTADDCRTWWSDPGTDVTGLNMNFEDNPGHIRAATAGAPQVGNFLANWHGNDNSAAFALAFSFDLSSLVMLLVFGGIALGIVVAKVAMVVMIALLFLALVASLWIGPGARIASYAKFYIGLAVFTFAISAIFALLNLITGFLVGAGARQFGPGSILAVLWSGFAPVTAIVVLHLLFKHVLRVPSPFKPSGALAYAGSIGGIGAAAGAGFERLLARARYRGEYRARQWAGGGWRNLRPGRGGRSGPGSMPMQPPPPKQLTAGAGKPSDAADLRAARSFVRTGQHLPAGRLETDTREWADRAGTEARTAWSRFFDHNRTDPDDRGDWGNLAAATGATLNAYTAVAGNRAVRATLGRGRYQLSRAKRGLAQARAATGNALQDMRSRPVRTALAAGGVTLAAATVGAPLVAGVTGVVLGRRALTARRDAARERSQQRDSELLALYADHQDARGT